jgi:hypothetical protein
MIGPSRAHEGKWAVAGENSCPIPDGVVRVPLQSVPPGKRLHTAPNNRFSPEYICTSLNALLVGHILLNPHPIQANPTHCNPTAHPSIRVNPPIVGCGVTLKVGTQWSFWV